MEKFVAEQKELLSLERDAEVEEARLLRSSVSLRELCEAGVAVQRLVVGGQATGLYGRLVVTLVSRGQHGADLAAHNITSGDIVELRTTQADLDQCSGVVTKVTSSSIAVAFSETFEHVNIDSSLVYSLVKLANDVTHKRLTKALNFLSGNPSSSVINVLFGISTPGVPHQSFHPKLLDHEGNFVFQNQDLDSSQRAAVEFCLKQRELGIVHGPPGTGKTTTVVEIIRAAVASGDKVLVTAPSNVAVDNLVERLARAGVKVVRLGHPARVNRELQHHSLDAIISRSDEAALVRDIYRELDQTLAGAKRNSDRRNIRTEVKTLRKEIREREKKAIKEILSRADVVLGTLTSSGPDSPLQHLPEKHFALTVIDECSQALEAACWIVASSASKLLLAGDHLQLPPTILSTEAASRGLALTLMERLVSSRCGPEVTRMLTTQYRMNARIMQWASDALYSGRLVAGAAVRDHTLAELPGVRASPATSAVLLLVDTAGCDMTELTTAENISKANEGEASIVFHHINELVELGVRVEDIAVVTPYNLQVELLRLNMRSRYPELEVKSVDGYQGREKEVVVLSLVRSNQRREVGFLAESRRLNVAVTRARRLLIVVCDSDTVKSDPFLREFLEYLEREGDVRTPDMYPDLPDITRPEGMIVAEVEVKKSSNNTNLENKKSEKKKTQKVDSKKTKQSENKPSEKKLQVPFSESKGKEEKHCENTKNETAEDMRRNEYEDILKQFVESKENFMTFSAELNSFERRLVHEISEELELNHESIGEGTKRYIMISKRIIEEKVKSKEPSNGKSDTENLQMKNLIDKKVVKEDDNSKSQLCNDIQKVETGMNSSTSTKSNDVECGNCNKVLPRDNIELHKLRCTVQQVDMKEHIDSVRKGPKPTKKSKKKKEPSGKGTGDEAAEDDFDSLCEQFQKLDKVCNYPKCKTLVATLGVNCAFCRVRFCLSHSMAEVHGCGEEARKAARQQTVREGRVVAGSGPVNHKPDRDKRAQLEKKLDKKLGEKNVQRQRKKKE